MSNIISLHSVLENRKAEYEQSVLSDVESGGIIVATKVLMETEYMKDVLLKLLQEEKIKYDHMKIGNKNVLVFFKYSSTKERQKHAKSAVA